MKAPKLGSQEVEDSLEALHQRYPALFAMDCIDCDYPNPPVSIALTNYQNAAYYGPIAMGTPEQEFTVLMDTASSDYWLPSIYCKSPACNGYNKYNPDISETARARGRYFQTKYYNATVSGVVGADQMNWAAFSIPSQDFGLAINITGSVE